MTPHTTSLQRKESESDTPVLDPETLPGDYPDDDDFATDSQDPIAGEDDLKDTDFLEEGDEG